MQSFVALSKVVFQQLNERVEKKADANDVTDDEEVEES